MRRKLFVKDVEGLWKNTGELDIHFGMLVLSHAITEHLKKPLNKQKLQFNVCFYSKVC